MIRKLKLLVLTVAITVMGASCISTGSGSGASTVPQLDPLKSVFRANVTSQAFHFYSPWQKKGYYTRTGMATIIGENQLLVPAALVRNHTYVELEKIKTGEKTPAKVLCVDYEVNLAIIAATDPKFLDGSVALSLVDKLSKGDKVKAWQFEANGTSLVTEGEMRRGEVVRYPHGSFLAYHVNITLPSYARPEGTPVVNGQKLIGLMLNYSSSTQSMRVVSAEVISHFLNDFGDGKYIGFPHAGFGYTKLDDPQLRDYVKLPKTEQGVYISYVRPNGPSALGGLKKGDVLLAVDSYDFDRLGQYEDPNYGKLSFSHINTTLSASGDTRTCHVWRDGKKISIPIKLRPLSSDDYTIAPYVYDRGPDYVITGGLVFIELSRQFLKEWGSDWNKKAPQRLVHYDRTQFELFKPDTKLVVMTRILRTQANGGYDDLLFRALKEVNGKKITCLGDIAKALATPIKGGFHRFEFNSKTRQVILDAKSVEQSDAAIQRYIPKLRRLTRHNAK